MVILMVILIDFNGDLMGFDWVTLYPENGHL